MKKTVIGAIALLGAMAVTPVSAKETISAVGSSSVTPLMEVFSETYMRRTRTYSSRFKALALQLALKRRKMVQQT